MKVPQNVQKTTIKNIQKKVTHRSRGARMMSMILAFLLAFQTPISFVYAEDGSETPVVTAAEVNTDAAAEEEAAAQAQAETEAQAQAEAEVKAQAEAEAKAQAEAEQQTQSGENSNTDPNTTPETEEESSKGTDANNEQSENSTTESTTESTTTESTTESGSESESDSESESETETEKHVAADVTNEMGQLHLNVGSAWYTNASGEKRDLAEMEGGVSYAEVDEDTLRAEGNLTAGFSVLYRLTENGEARTIQGTDYVQVCLPEWMTNVRLTENGQKIKAGEAEFDGASYEINNEAHTLKITFKKSMDEEGRTDINGSVGLTFDVNKSVFTETANETPVVLQSKDGNENRARIILPAKLQEENAIFARGEELGITEDLNSILYPVMPLDGEDTNAISLASDDETTETTETEAPTFKYNGSASAQVIWQDQTPLSGGHSLLPGTITGTLTTTTTASQVVKTYDKDRNLLSTGNPTDVTITGSTSDTEEIIISYDKNGTLSFGTVDAASNGFVDGHIPPITASTDNNLNYTIQGKSLPSQKKAVTTTTVKGTTSDESGNTTETITTTTTTTTYAWTMKVDQPTSANKYLIEDSDYKYLMTVAEKTSPYVYTMTPTTSFLAEVKIYTGGSKAEEEWDALEKALQVYVNGNAINGDSGIVDKYDQLKGYVGTPKIGVYAYHFYEGSYDGDDYAYGLIQIGGIPECDVNKKEYVYSAAAQDNFTGGDDSSLTGKVCIAINDGSGDCLIQEIDNSTSGNYGNVTDKVHQGGVMKLTRYGTTEYKASKYWLDDDNSSVTRPTITWSLWRYSTNGGDYTTGAPVRNAADNQVQVTVNSSGDDAKAGTEISVSFDGTGEYQLNGMKLPKYDPTGWEYVYYAKEEMSGDNQSLYQKVYGTPTEDGVNTAVESTSGDTAPNWISHKEKKTDEDWSRGSDTSIYNGGSLCNRLTSTTPVDCTKKWIADRYQNEMKNVAVVLTLQSHLKSDASATWTDVKENGTTVTTTLDSFNAANMSATASESRPKYDSLGRELEYQWVETKLIWTATDSDGKTSTTDIYPTTLDGKTVFRLPVNTTQTAVDGDEYFISTDTTGEDGSLQVTNTLVGTTQYDVWKVWKVKPSSSVEVVLKQRSTDGSVKRYTYTMSSHKNYESGAKNEVGETWHLEITRLSDSEEATNDNTLPACLPKYDANGCRYEYTVEEVGKDTNKQEDYHADYEYNTKDTNIDGNRDGSADTNNVVITNNPVGEGKEIRVRKVWLDDGDADCRSAVTLAIYRKAVSGNPIDTARDTDNDGYVPVKNANGVEVTTTLSVNNQWWTWVGVSEYTAIINGTTYVGTKAEVRKALQDANLDTTGMTLYKDGTYFIQEVSMGGNAVSYNNLSQRGFPTVKGSNGNHGYEVFYAAQVRNTSGVQYGGIEDGSYTAYNRRIGQIDIDVTKKWVDDGQTAEYRKNLGATIELVAGENEGVTITTSDSGSAVTLGTDTYGKSTYAQPIYNSNAPEKTQVSSVQALTGSENGTDATIHFYNLPKYDYQGRILYYSVKENDSGDGKLARAEYVTSTDDGDYTAVTDDSAVYGSEDHVSKAIAVTNQREATKKVEFHKRWIDKAVFTAGNRPDIYISLYKYDSTCTDGYAVSYGYKDFKWTKDATDSDYYWTCTFEDLPKYDTKGAEIIYYATETSKTDMTQLDYVPVQFATTDPKTGYSSANTSYLSTLSWHEATSYSDSDAYVVNYNASTPSNDNTAPWVLKTMNENEDGWDVLKEGGCFVNELRSNVIVNGKKVWENIPDGFPVGELPQLTFSLDQVDKNGDTVYTLTSGVGTITKVTSSATTFSFQFKYTGENAQEEGKAKSKTNPSISDFIPKYNPADGSIYNYAVSETIVNGTGSGAADTEIIYDSDVNNYDIKNTYNLSTGNVGKITISKTWDAKNEYTVDSDQRAEATFTLKRFYLNAKGDQYITDSDFSEILRLNATKTTDGTSTTYTAEGSFENLQVTAPNYRPYFYYIVEDSIDGYEESVTIDSGTVTMATDTEKNITNYPTGGSDKVSAFKFKSSGTDSTTSKTTYCDAKVTAKNTYEKPDTVSLSITKNWTDDNNWTQNNRTVTLRLYRYANDQSKNSNNAISKKALYEWVGTGSSSGITTKFYYVNASTGAEDNSASSRNVSGAVTAALNTGDNNTSDSWTLTLSGLDKYAPNGAQWEYEIKEVATDTYYTGKDTVSKEASTSTDGATITMKALTNKNQTSLKVTKEWAQNSSLKQYDTVYALQVKKGTDASGSNDGTWQWAKAFMTAENYTAPTSTSSGFAYTQKMSAGSTSIEFTDLPRSCGKDGIDYPLQWRAVEIKIGDNLVEFGTDNDSNHGTYEDDSTKLASLSTEYDTSQSDNILYQPENTADTAGTNDGNSVSASTSAIKNTPLGGTLYLEITKTWSGDQQNAFKTRQLDGATGSTWAVHFLIQRKISSATGFSDIATTSSNQFVVTLTDKNTIVSSNTTNDTQSYTLKIEGLPDKASDGMVYQYIAREAMKNGDSWVAVADSTGDTNADSLYYGYQVTNNADDSITVFTDTTSSTVEGYKDGVTNSLRTTTRTLTKTWVDEQNIRSNKTPAFTLWVKDGQNGTWSKASAFWGVNNSLINPTTSSTGTGDSATYTWSLLPGVSTKGNTYIYGVSEATVTGYTAPNYAGTVENASDNTRILVLAATADSTDTNTVTNTATQFYLNKVYEGDTNPLQAGESVTLTLTGSTSGTTKDYTATWTCKATTAASGDTAGSYTYSVEVKSGNTSIYKVTNSSSNPVIKGLPMGSYTLTESATVKRGEGTAAASSPDGYVNLTGTNTVTLSSDDAGNTKLTKNGDNLSLTKTVSGATADDTVQVTNKKTIFSLKKTNANGTTTLKDAEFTLSGIFPARLGITGNVKLVTGTDGMATATATVNDTDNTEVNLASLLIVGQSYTLTETKAPAGYILPSSALAFTVGKTGELSITSGTSDVYSVTAPTSGAVKSQVMVADKTISIDIIKYNESGTSDATLAGAKFSLYEGDKVDADKIIDNDIETTYTAGTGATAHVTLDGATYSKLVVGGTYTLYETAAPDGFALPRTDSDRIFTFKIGTDGTITAVTDGDSEQSSKFFVIDSTSKTTIKVTNLHEFKMVKLDDVKAASDATNAEITDDTLELTVSDTSGNALFTWGHKAGGYWLTKSDYATAGEGKDTLQYLIINTTNGIITGLPAGTYTVKETGTPKEYVSVSATFTLGEDGKLTIANGSTSVGSTTTATVDDQELNVLQITDKRLRGKAILTKTDKDSDSTLLNGVEFTLQKKDANGEWKDHMTGLLTGKTYTYNETAGQTATGVAGDEGVLTITDLFYGDYRLVETASLDGYATVEVKGSGSEAAPVKWAFTVDRESCDATTGTATFTYGAKNPKTKLTLTKKADGDSVLLEGTVFTLTGEKFAGDYAGQTSLELTTDENGQILLEGVLVTGVEYTLTEKTPTDGYRICIGELKFTLDKDGKATVVGDAPGGYSDITAILTSGSYENAITVTNQQTGLTIYKKNEAKTSALAGTSFTLEGEKFAGDHKGETSLDLTTDENGEITLTGVLVAGVEYKLTETKPTDGYSLRTKTLIFKLDKKGVAHVEGSAPTGYTLVGLAEEGTTDNEVTVTDAQTTLNLIKKVTDDTILADTAFTITGEFAGAHKGETSIVLTTGEDGTITLPGELIVGKEYTLEETKPTDGYNARKGTCTFTLESDGEAKILGDAPEGYELEASQVEDGKYANTFTVTDKPTRFSIIKKGEGSTEPLAGTTFEISGKFAGEHKDDQSITFITGEDGTYTFTKVLIAEETYTLKEIAPTDGYSIRTEILTFKLDLHGKAYLEGNTPTGYEMTGLNTDSKEFANEVTVTDAQTDLSIIKKGEVSAEDTGDTTDPDNTDGDEGTDTGSTKLLADTTFTLTGEKFAGDYGEQTSIEGLTTDENGQILLEGVLVTGVEYTLTETNPTDGYNIRTGELKFKLEFDGEAKIIGEAPTGYELQVSKTEDGKYTNTITATDAQTSFDLVKKGKVYDEEGNVADPKLLKDTEFVLTGEKFAGEYEDETSINLTTDEKGEISLQGVLITGVEYTLKETKPTAGYQLLAGELKFQLELDSKAQVVGEAPQGYELTATQVEDGKYTNVFTVTDEPTNFSFGKRLVGDSLTTGVAEAQFTITPEEGKTLADGSDSYSWTSAENPEKLTELLVSGDTYTLTETLAPEGALSVTEDHQLSYKFTLDETGTLITPETPAEGSADGLTAEDDLVTIWDTPTIVLLRKTGTDLAASGKDLLAGCTFKITGRFAAGRYEGQEQTEAGEHTLMVTTDGTDITCLALKGRLITGETYTLEEVVAPDGYATGMHVSFTVTGAKRLKDGTAVTQIQLAEADQEKGYEITTEDSGYPVILQKDDPVELVLKKMAKEDASKALAGAEFTLTGVFAGESSESTKTITTDSNGCVDLSKQLIESREGKEYTYRLKETKAPDGYDLTEGEIIFKMVSADGEGRKARIELVQVTSDSLQSLVSIANPDEEVPVLTVANVLTPEPETESGNGTGSDQTTNPTKTGDTTAVWPYLFALAAAATALAGVEVRRKKQSHK